eukprot:6203198-Pleurochrysis_carterae.AAC.5
MRPCCMQLLHARTPLAMLNGSLLNMRCGATGEDESACMRTLQQDEPVCQKRQHTELLDACFQGDLDDANLDDEEWALNEERLGGGLDTLTRQWNGRGGAKGAAGCRLKEGLPLM